MSSLFLLIYLFTICKLLLKYLNTIQPSKTRQIRIQIVLFGLNYSNDLSLYPFPSDPSLIVCCQIHYPFLHIELASTSFLSLFELQYCMCAWHRQFVTIFQFVDFRKYNYIPFANNSIFQHILMSIFFCQLLPMSTSSSVTFSCFKIS